MSGRSKPRVLITGAAGNLGVKLRQHLEGRYELRLLDCDPRGDPAIHAAELSRWENAWVKHFDGVDAVVHLAADPVAYRSWAELIAPNLDALANTCEAAAQAKVKRFVFASSNHVMGGYQERPVMQISADLPPLPGTRYVAEGVARDSTPYAAGKLFGERLGKCYAESRGLSVIAVRIGWVRPGENRPDQLPIERGEWFRQMWLSNRDFCQLMECCLLAVNRIGFAIVNGMSNNRGMRWDITATRDLLGYQPQDDVDKPNLNFSAHGRA